MKKLVTILSIATALAFALTACGGQNNETASVTPETQVATEITSVASTEPQVYHLYAEGAEGSLISAADMDAFTANLTESMSEYASEEEAEQATESESIFSSAAVTLNGDGTAIMTAAGETVNGTYEISGTDIKLHFEENGETSDLSGTVENGIMTLNDLSEGALSIFVTDDADVSGIETVSIEDYMSQLYGTSEIVTEEN